ncbi:MAG: M81 family metallopeptidase, partial [Halobacteriales archaeon]|nr:M81 family metallopeptidase [Halobacteriales archaeon]
MTRIGVGEVWQEVNSFSPLPTRREDFDIVSGEAMVEQFAETESELGGIIDTLRDEVPDVDLVPALSARAVPRGPVDDTVYTWVRDRFTEAFADADLDAVVLSLHGAMVTDDRADPEGALLEHIRDLVGPIPVVTSLDHHANVTPVMVEAADAFVAFREHPHRGPDIRATGERAATIAARTLDGSVAPTMAMVKAPFVTTTGLSTTDGAMADLFTTRERLEQEAGTLSVSLCPVQPWLDVPDLGFAAIAVTDASSEAAAGAADRLARAAWDRRDDFGETFPSVDEAIDRARDGETPVVLADRGDVTLGGAPGDSPVVLRRLLERTDTESLSAAIPIVDPDGVASCMATDDGAVTVEVGGKLTPGFDPVEVTGRVVWHSAEPLQLAGDYYGGQPVDMV